MSGHDTHSHGGHGGPLIYGATLIGLLILTGITVGASYIDFGPANVAIALIIASCKAILVALFFMHLKWDKPVNAIAAISGFLFLGIFLMFDLIDLSNRRDPTPRIIKPMAQPTAVPDSMNPLLTPAPKPYVPEPKKAEGEHGAEAH
jgi:cytochrome c oxidase subunit 4